MPVAHRRFRGPRIVRLVVVERPDDDSVHGGAWIRDRSRVADHDERRGDGLVPQVCEALGITRQRHQGCQKVYDRLCELDAVPCKVDGADADAVARPEPELRQCSRGD